MVSTPRCNLILTAGKSGQPFNHFMASEPLNALLAAPSREALGAFLAACFRFRGRPDELAASRAVTGLGLPPDQAFAVAVAGSLVVSAVLYKSADSSIEAVSKCIPESVDPRLQQLLASVSRRTLARQLNIIH